MACSLRRGTFLSACSPGTPFVIHCRLSEVVCEELDESLAVPPLLPLPELAAGVSLQAVRERLRSGAFARAAYSVHSAHSSLLRFMRPLTLNQVRWMHRGKGCTGPLPHALRATL
jgi:hypothetical protein